MEINVVVDKLSGQKPTITTLEEVGFLDFFVVVVDKIEL